MEKKHPPIPIAFTHNNWLHTITNDNKYTTRQHVQPVNLCSRDTASRDHAFLSGLLATPTTVSKTSRGRCVQWVSGPLLRLFQKPKWDMKTSLDAQYDVIGIMYTV